MQYWLLTFIVGVFRQPMVIFYVTSRDTGGEAKVHLYRMDSSIKVCQAHRER